MWALVCPPDLGLSPNSSLPAVTLELSLPGEQGCEPLRPPHCWEPGPSREQRARHMVATQSAGVPWTPRAPTQAPSEGTTCDRGWQALSFVLSRLRQGKGLCVPGLDPSTPGTWTSRPSAGTASPGALGEEQQPSSDMGLWAWRSLLGTVGRGGPAWSSPSRGEATEPNSGRWALRLPGRCLKRRKGETDSSSTCESSEPCCPFIAWSMQEKDQQGTPAALCSQCELRTGDTSQPRPAMFPGAGALRSARG